MPQMSKNIPLLASSAFFFEQLIDIASTRLINDHVAENDGSHDSQFYGSLVSNDLKHTF